MTRALSRAAFLGAFLALALGAGARPAMAQVPPLPPVPQPSFPPQVQPVFEIMAPTLYPQCGTMTVGIILAGQNAGALPVTGLTPAIFSATAPVAGICGQVPRPGTQLTCLMDAQAQAVVNAVTAQAGAAVPLGLHPEGDIVEQTFVVQDALPPPAKSPEIGPTAAVLLGCAQIAAPTPSNGDFSSAPTDLGPPPSYPQSPSIPGTIPGIGAPPATQSVVPPVLNNQPSRPTTAGDAVRYAAVWFLPLGLLLFGGYFGGALTRDIELGSLPA